MLWQGNAVGALAASRKALALDTKLSSAYPMNAHYRQEAGIDFEKVGNTLDNLGDINGALESYRNELRIFEEQPVSDPVFSITISERRCLKWRSPSWPNLRLGEGPQRHSLDLEPGWSRSVQGIKEISFLKPMGPS